VSRVVLTGATGYLGRHVVRALTADNGSRAPIALSRRPAPELEAEGVEVRVGSLHDGEWLRAQLPEGCRILHLAGRVAFEGPAAAEMHGLHVDATRALVDAATARDCRRFVLLSSSGVSAVSASPRTHDEVAGYPIGIIGRWPYYLSKMLQERLVLDRVGRDGLPAVVLNPSLLLGPALNGSTSTGIVEDAAAGRIPFVPAGGVSAVDVRDVAGAVVAALERGEVGERYFLATLNCPFDDFFRRLEACGAGRVPRIPVPGAAGVLGARLLRRVTPDRAAGIHPMKMDMAQHFWYADASKARAELGFSPRRIDETLRETVASCKV
jgi:dihydroflavonol-4-reductase